MSNLLSDRLAVVTGGGSGIGRAVCLAFAREGARVIVTDLDKDSAAKTLKDMHDSSKHLAKYMDVTSSKSVKETFAEVIAEYGVPNVLVNCAGIIKESPMVELTEKKFDDVVAVNLKGTFLTCQIASKEMLKAKITDGSLVNISSCAGKVGNLWQSNYAASKAGVDGFTKTTARELAPLGIRCNAVRPGYIDTPLIAGMTKEAIEQTNKIIPMGRFGKPEEVAEVCVFLASRRSSYVTGSIVQVSGGCYI